MPFTPLGVRTLDGFRKQYGEEGEHKFRQAMDKGLIDRAKMERAHKTQEPPKSAGKLPHTVEATNNERTAAPRSPRVTVSVSTEAPAPARAAPGTFQARGG